MLGRPGHPVFSRFAAKAEVPPPKPEPADAPADDALRKSAPPSAKAA